MPVDRHLQKTELTDFAPGLWENADWLMPASAAQVMQDCYPQPGGGLRAFFKKTAVSTAGIVAPTLERPIGLFVRGGVAARAGGTDLADRYLCTFFFNAAAGAGSKARPRLYRMDGTNGETTWTQIFKTSGSTEFAFAANDANSAQQTSFRFFRQSSGSPNDQWVIMCVRYQGGDTGLYRLNYNDLSTVQKAIQLTSSATGITSPTGPIAVHQARVVAGGGSATVPERLVWSNVGDAGTAWPAANFLDVEPNQLLPGLSAIHPQPPGDLIICKEGAPWVSVQGDITNPIVRALGEGVAGPTINDVVGTPEGIAFIAPDGYVYLTNGYQFSPLSQQLGGFATSPDIVGFGYLSFANQFLFAPGGYVYDFASKSWFKQTQIPGAFTVVDRYNRTVLGTTSTGVSFGLGSIKPWVGVGTRASTFTWKSAPLRDPGGNQIVIRGVQIVFKAYAIGDQLAVTVNGVTVTKTATAIGNQDFTFLFKQRAPVLDVQVVSTAAGSGEAPSIDAIRIQWRSGHITY